VFEQSQNRRIISLWKILPLALLVFVIIVAAAIYLGRVEKSEVTELTNVLRQGDSDFAWYSKYIKLKDPKIQMGQNFAGNRVVMFSGVVENGGERTIDVVEVKIVFYNYEEPVSETTRSPIRPGPYTPSLPPLTSRAFGFYVEDFPRGWMAANAEMSLNGFRFEDAEDY
jgi:hypothetical protein